MSRTGGATARPRAPHLHTQEEGSQALEFALALPFVVLALVLMAHAAMLGADVIAAQAVAFQAARVAAVEDDAAVQQAAAEAAGEREIRVVIEPTDEHRRHGDEVTATVRVRSVAFEPFGAQVWVPARAALRVERP